MRLIDQICVCRSLLSHPILSSVSSSFTSLPSPFYTACLLAQLFVQAGMDNAARVDGGSQGVGPGRPLGKFHHPPVPQFQEACRGPRRGTSKSSASVASCYPQKARQHLPKHGSPLPGTRRVWNARPRPGVSVDYAKVLIDPFLPPLPPLSLLNRPTPSLVR